jgi:mannan endo-1,4-beta-mannosidase
MGAFVRRLALNLLPLSAAVLLLVVLTLFAAWSARPPHLAAARPAAGRLFGVYVDPWHLTDWEQRVGVRPNLVAKFEAFARRRTVAKFLGQVERDGTKQVMISWEPWKPVPARLGWRRQARQQPGYTNAQIAAGAQDRYIRRFAARLASFNGTVYLRYAHEMNGFWYPWSVDSHAYVKAWRHVARLVRAAAPNARFVWSVNPNLYEARRPWFANLRRYWPGARFVDVVGMTMINFGGIKHYDVARFGPALSRLRKKFGKPVYLTETNTAKSGRVRWLRDLQSLLATRPWVRAIAWSQLPSRGAVQQKAKAGDLRWQVASDPAAARALRGVALRESR